jgi:hypothetical protein
MENDSSNRDTEQDPFSTLPQLTSQDVENLLHEIWTEGPTNPVATEPTEENSKTLKELVEATNRIGQQLTSLNKIVRDIVSVLKNMANLQVRQQREDRRRRDHERYTSVSSMHRDSTTRSSVKRVTKD